MVSLLPNKVVSSVQFSVMSHTLRPYRLQHARLPCPSPLLELPQLMSIESVMPSNHLILCHPLLLLPSNFPSISDFSNESAIRIRWPSIDQSFSTSPSNEYPGLISSRMDWLDLLVIQGDSKSLFQHQSTLRNL